MSYGTMNGMGYMGGWGGMAFGGLMMLFWFVLLVVLIVFVVRLIGRTPGRDTGADAREILKQRFARGEIDTEEYEERSRQLRASP